MTAETNTAPNVEQAVPFFRVSDMEKSLRYYVDGLGFQMKYKWIDEGARRMCRRTRSCRSGRAKSRPD